MLAIEVAARERMRDLLHVQDADHVVEVALADRQPRMRRRAQHVEDRVPVVADVDDAISLRGTMMSSTLIASSPSILSASCAAIGCCCRRCSRSGRGAATGVRRPRARAREQSSAQRSRDNGDREHKTC